MEIFFWGFRYLKGCYHLLLQMLTNYKTRKKATRNINLNYYVLLLDMRFSNRNKDRVNAETDINNANQDEEKRFDKTVGSHLKATQAVHSVLF